MTSINYKSGSLWKSRCKIYALDADSGKWKYLPACSVIMVLGIKEEFSQTHIKLLHKGRIYYIEDVDPALMFSMDWKS